jgi:hypothetical protein
MTSYSKTWDTDSAGYRTLTKRALEKVETNAAKMWLVGRSRASVTENTWDDHGPSGANDRVFGTTYTNGSTARLVVVTGLCAPGFNVAATRTSTMSLNIAGTSYGIVAQSSSPVAAVSSITAHVSAAFIVNPNQTYVITAGGTGTAPTLAYWYEFDFNSVHTAQTYTTGTEQPTSTKLNAYAGAVNDMAQATLDSTDDTESVATGSTGTAPTECTLYLIPVNLGSGGASGDCTIQIKNSGGTLKSVGRVSTNYNGSVSRATSFIVNGSGGWKPINNSGTVNSPLVARRYKFPVATAITFSNGESGSGTTQKWLDLDTNGSTAANKTLDFTFTNRGSGIGSVTPSATRWTLVAATISLVTTTTTAADIDLVVDGYTISSIGAEPANTSARRFTILFLVPPGASYSFVNNTGNGTVENRLEWVPQS